MEAGLARIPIIDTDVTAPTLLLVDDDPFMLEVLADVLAQQGCRILKARSGAEALEHLAREPVQVILCDQCMPGMDGTELLARVRRLDPATYRIILSGQGEQGAIGRALQAGDVDRYFPKPWSGANLLAALREALALQRERARL
jgi:two-component system cell cycle response regulator